MLTATVNSPTLQHAIATFLEPFGDGKHVTYDALSTSAILDAHERTHGARALPRYRFEDAEVIVGLDADFLGTWISPVEYTAGYRVRREPPHMSWHAQLESRMSITGAKADKRLAVAPEEVGAIAARLAASVARLAGSQPRTGIMPKTSVDEKTIDEIAQRLWAARGKSLVVCGRNDACKDLNRNALESRAWTLASMGFENLFAISGDYPAAGYRGNAFVLAPKGLALKDGPAGLWIAKDGNDGSLVIRCPFDFAHGPSVTKTLAFMESPSQ